MPSWRVLLPVVAVLAAAVVSAIVLGAVRSAQAASGTGPYEAAPVVDTNPHPDIVETTIVAQESTVDVGGGVMADVLTFNGTVPGPEFRLKVGDTVIVRFENRLDQSTGIHWHGIELANISDGTQGTQNEVAPGESYLYRFQVPRPGVFWYHPHHHSSTNQVFKGMYGTMVIADPHEDALVRSGVLPPDSQTRTLALSDITVCKEPGANDPVTHDPSLPWVGGDSLPVQPPPTPTTLCETPVDEHGHPIVDEAGNPVPLSAGEVPNIQVVGRVNEGQTVLTNGINVGGRAGSPDDPGALAPGASVLEVRPGEGLRLQMVNTSAVRFTRLRLTDASGAQIPLVRVGGEGGLLDRAVLDGGSVDGLDLKYDVGEVLLAPSERADVVAAIPADAAGVATLWTQDYARAAGFLTGLPTVPVMHLDVKGRAGSYQIDEGTPLRASIPGAAVESLDETTGTTLDPATFATPKPGMASPDISLTMSGLEMGIDGISSNHGMSGGGYATEPHKGATRYLQLGDTVELTVTNATPLNHPFHLHGFSFQPVAFEKPGGPNHTVAHREFVDSVDIPPGYTLRFRVRIEDRPMVDGVTPGGGMGRWMYHCHILPHADLGMMSELVVVDAEGNERPYVDTDGASATAPRLGTATMTGTHHDRDGDAVALSASVGTVVDNGDGTWRWTYDRPTSDSRPSADGQVFITATDEVGHVGQVVFDLDVVNPPAVTDGPPGHGGGGHGGPGHAGHGKPDSAGRPDVPGKSPARG